MMELPAVRRTHVQLLSWLHVKQQQEEDISCDSRGHMCWVQNPLFLPDISNFNPTEYDKERENYRICIFFPNSINLHNTDFADFLLFFHHLAEECAENGFQSSGGAESRKPKQSRLDRPEKK